MGKSIHERLAKLEQVEVPQLNIAERMREARERRNAMTPEQRREDSDARAAARREWAANTPKPEGGTSIEAQLRLSMWQAARWEIERLSRSDGGEAGGAPAVGVA